MEEQKTEQAPPQAQPKKAKPKAIISSDNKKLLESLTENAIELRRCVFFRTISSRGGEGFTESALHNVDTKPSRVGRMWYTPHGVVIEQTRGFKIIPLANVTDTDIL